MAPRRDLAVDVRGLAELQRALKRSESELGPWVRAGLQDIGKPVQQTAQRHARERTEPPRRGEHVGRLAESIRLSVTQRQASIYSRIPYAGAQEYGGHVGPGHHSYIPPKRFMERAVVELQENTARRFQHLLDEIALGFER